MKKTPILYILLLFAFNLNGQNKEILNIYRPNETELYTNISKAIDSNDIIVIKQLYNQNGSYSYLLKKSFIGKGKTLVFEFYGNVSTIDFQLKNIMFSEFDKVIFNVFNNSQITIDSCSFNDIVNGVLFEFKENLSDDINQSSISIKNSSFFDSSLNKNHSDYTAQLQFNRNQYANGLAKLNNVIIENCKFLMNDSRESWEIESAFNTYPQRHSIVFFRTSSDAAFSNISINNNYFEDNANYFRTEAITFGNYYLADFRTPTNLYDENQNIAITNNVMTTNSDDPGHGIFVEGPYQNVKVNGNKIDNYGMNIFDGKTLDCDGAIHLYGARNSKYSDDIIDSEIIDNNITSGNVSINVLGTQNSIIKDNKVEILPWPKFYSEKDNLTFPDRMGIRVTTGDYSDSTKESKNVTIENNIINCNKEEASFGILMQSARDFKILDNKIIEPTNFGILIFGHKNEKDIDFGNSEIENNLIYYKDINFTTLKTNFYNYDKMSFAAIKVYRMDNGQSYKNEVLNIKRNSVIDKSNTIPLISIDDLTKSEIAIQK